jgi:hypothetical protein
MLNDTRKREERPGDCLSSDICSSAFHWLAWCAFLHEGESPTNE